MLRMTDLAPTMEQLGRRVAEWRAILLDNTTKKIFLK